MQSTESLIKKSFKWSIVTEASVKIITPILNAILARILLPEDYAPLTTILMLLSFCEVFVESGFKKYLVQHQFASAEEERNAFHVASWTMLTIALTIWALIAAFCKPLSAFLGNGEIWLAVAVSGSILPMYAMIGILNATIQKQLAFQKLFLTRVITASIPLVITIPLAIMGLKYWSLVIGNIASILAQMLALQFQSKYRIKLFYSFRLLREMFSDTMWTLMDGVAVWLTSWLDSLIITRLMTDHYLGLYKNSLQTVTSLFSLVTAAITPVLFVGLTKYQKDDKQFSGLFTRTQQILATFLIPMGIGIFLYQDLAVSILFGNEWAEAAQIVGITAVTIALRTIYVSFCGDAYRAKGFFKIPLILQLVDLGILVPTCLLSAKQGFWMLVYMRAAERLILIIPEILVMRKFLKISVKEQFQKQIPIAVSALGMTVVALLLQQVGTSMIWQFVSIAICAVIYFAILLLGFPQMRKEIMQVGFVQKIMKMFTKERA